MLKKLTGRELDLRQLYNQVVKDFELDQSDILKCFLDLDSASLINTYLNSLTLDSKISNQKISYVNFNNPLIFKQDNKLLLDNHQAFVLKNIINQLLLPDSLDINYNSFFTINQSQSLTSFIQNILTLYRFNDNNWQELKSEFGQLYEKDLKKLIEYQSLNKDLIQTYSSHNSQNSLHTNNLSSSRSLNSVLLINQHDKIHHVQNQLTAQVASLYGYEQSQIIKVKDFSRQGLYGSFNKPTQDTELVFYGTILNAWFQQYQSLSIDPQALKSITQIKPLVLLVEGQQLIEDLDFAQAFINDLSKGYFSTTDFVCHQHGQVPFIEKFELNIKLVIVSSGIDTYQINDLLADYKNKLNIFASYQKAHYEQNFIGQLVSRKRAQAIYQNYLSVQKLVSQGRYCALEVIDKNKRKKKRRNLEDQEQEYIIDGNLGQYMADLAQEKQQEHLNPEQRVKQQLFEKVLKLVEQEYAMVDPVYACNLAKWYVTKQQANDNLTLLSKLNNKKKNAQLVEELEEKYPGLIVELENDDSSLSQDNNSSNWRLNLDALFVYISFVKDYYKVIDFVNSKFKQLQKQTTGSISDDNKQSQQSNVKINDSVKTNVTDVTGISQLVEQELKETYEFHNQEQTELEEFEQYPSAIEELEQQLASSKVKTVITSKLDNLLVQAFTFEPILEVAGYGYLEKQELESLEYPEHCAMLFVNLLASQLVQLRLMGYQGKLELKDLSDLIYLQQKEDQDYNNICWDLNLTSSCLEQANIQGISISNYIQKLESRHSLDYLHELELVKDNYVNIYTGVNQAFIGQINGLAYFDTNQLNKNSGGNVFRMTCVTTQSLSSLVDVDSVAELSGKFAVRANMLAHSFITSLFKQELVFGGYIVTEQLYTETDGDSGTVACACAMLSALAGVALKQSLAVTGAFDQYGNITAVGGLNQKIRAFFDICKQRGFEINQGVIVPEVNCKNLVLDSDIILSVEQGLFNIYSASHVSQVIELLTDYQLTEKEDAKICKIAKTYQPSIPRIYEQTLVERIADEYLDNRTSRLEVTRSYLDWLGWPKLTILFLSLFILFLIYCYLYYLS